MIIVIADDVTGAAEMAGVALRNNLNVQFITDFDGYIPVTDVLVIATDTRSFDKAEATETMRHIAGYLTSEKNIYIFKKTDSVLRGHIMAELETLSECLGYDNTILLPQNPSKGRVIKGGRYYVDRKSLEETSFGFDPEFPASTSYVEDIASGSVSMHVDSKPLSGKVNIGDASNSKELQKQVDKISATTLVAGAADTFNLFIKHCNTPPYTNETKSKKINNGKTIVVCGSTQSKSLIEMPYFKRRSSIECGMPYDVFHGESADKWIDSLQEDYATHQAIIIKIGHEATGGKNYAVRLRETMAAAVSRLMAVERPDLLVIEGGATAFAALRKLAWNCFNVKKELSPGVVCLTYEKTDIVLKPGSYPWGNLFE